VDVAFRDTGGLAILRAECGRTGDAVRRLGGNSCVDFIEGLRRALRGLGNERSLSGSFPREWARALDKARDTQFSRGFLQDALDEDMYGKGMVARWNSVRALRALKARRETLHQAASNAEAAPVDPVARSAP
jgi:hypothetical protein